MQKHWNAWKWALQVVLVQGWALKAHFGAQLVPLKQALPKVFESWTGFNLGKKGI